MNMSKMKIARVTLGLTQKDLAELVDKRKQWVSEIECGNENATPELAQAIATVLGMQRDDLFTEERVPEKIRYKVKE